MTSSLVVLCLPYSEVRQILSGYLSSSLGEQWTPDLYIAEKCQGLLEDAAANAAYDKLATGFTVHA